MGIEKFFISLQNTENNEIKKSIKRHDDVNNNTYQINAENIYIDFNSILYKITNELEENINIILIDLIYHNKISDEHYNKVKKYNTDILTTLNLNISNEIEKNIVSNDQYEIKTLNDFNNIYTEEKLDQIFINMIIADIQQIVTNYINPNKIKKIYISMDGIPNMAKIVVQRKRRYTNYVISELKNYIYKTYDKDMSDKRKIFEKNRIRLINRNKNNFNNKIIQILKHQNYFINLKKMLPLLESYKCSDYFEYGEGEKKIMEDIIANKNKEYDNYLIYSPDSDIIVLSIIIKNQLTYNPNNFNIMRYNQQEKNYDIININAIENTIYEYILNKIPNVNLDKKNLLNDIMFIFNIFGNDFIHKIDSIDIQKDFQLLLYVYSILLNTNKIVYLTYNFNGIYKINYKQFIKYIGILKDYEQIMISETYLLKNYRNYSHLKKIFNGDVHLNMINYCKGANIIFTYINSLVEYFNSHSYQFINNYKIVQHKIKAHINRTYDSLMELLLNSNSHKNIRFNYKFIFDNSDSIKCMIKNFIKIEIIKSSDNLEYVTYDLLKKYIIQSIRYDTITNNIYTILCPKLSLYEYDSNPKNTYHKNKIVEQMVYNEFKTQIENVDYVLYEIDNMIGEYKYKLNAVNDFVGKIEFKIVNGLYVYSYQTPAVYSKIYYDSYCNKENISLDDLCYQYISGIFWIFDFYFNKNNNAFNKKMISLWFYKYNTAPLLQDLWQYLYKLEKNKLDKIYHKTINNLIYIKKFLNFTEHYLYITPKYYINDIDEYYLKSINNNPHIFPDLEKIAYQIHYNDQNDTYKNTYNESIPIDNRRSMYLTKAILKNIAIIDFHEFIKIFS